MNPRLVVSTQEMPLLQPKAMTTGELVGFMVSVDSPQLESAPQATLEIAQECYSHVVEVGTTVLGAIAAQRGFHSRAVNDAEGFNGLLAKGTYEGKAAEAIKSMRDEANGRAEQHHGFYAASEAFVEARDYARKVTARKGTKDPELHEQEKQFAIHSLLKSFNQLSQHESLVGRFSMLELATAADYLHLSIERPEVVSSMRKLFKQQVVKEAVTDDASQNDTATKTAPDVQMQKDASAQQIPKADTIPGTLLTPTEIHLRPTKRATLTTKLFGKDSTSRRLRRWAEETRIVTDSEYKKQAENAMLTNGSLRGDIRKNTAQVIHHGSTQGVLLHTPEALLDLVSYNKKAVRGLLTSFIDAAEHSDAPVSSTVMLADKAPVSAEEKGDINPFKNLRTTNIFMNLDTITNALPQNDHLYRYVTKNHKRLLRYLQLRRIATA